MTTIYLVGDKDSEKRNSWLAMTNCEQRAKELLAELGGVVIKPLEVPPPKRKKK